ncbi:MAG: hypothetical protein RR404_03395 [Bacilli bacterium]
MQECSTYSSTKFTQMVSTDVYQISGDSKGIAYYTLKLTFPEPSREIEAHLTAGIGIFKSSADQMIFTRADYINSAFGLSRY